MVELRLLRTFIAVAAEGSVTKAAASLGMAQPPVTRQLAALEAVIGGKLFDRLPRGVRLTDVGVATLEEAQTLLRHHDAMMDRIARTSRGEIGHIAVGFTISARGHPQIASFLKAFHETWPHAQLSFRENNTDPLLSDLAAGRLDAAFIRTPDKLPLGVRAETLLEEPMLVVMPQDHPLAKSHADEPLSLSKL